MPSKSFLHKSSPPDLRFQIRAYHPIPPVIKPKPDKNQPTMSNDIDNSLFAIQIGADDYAETAAEDTPTVSRTFQSEADFQAQKASYHAKIDNGNNYAALIEAVPVLAEDDETDLNPQDANGAEFTDVSSIQSKTKLGKRNTQLLGYAAGEMYYLGQFAGLIDLCERVQRRCLLDEKLEESLERWRRRCRERMEKKKKKKRETEAVA